MLIAATTPAAFDTAAMLRARITGFSGFLHANGFGVGGDDAARVLATAARVGILDPQVLRWSLKALLCGHAAEWRRFDGLFDAYFLPPNKKAFINGATDTPRNRELAGDSNEDAAVNKRRRPHELKDDNLVARYSASREESLAATDFRDLARADEIRAIEALVRRFARR